MSVSLRRISCAFVTGFLAAASMPTTSYAAPRDYRFEAVPPQVKAGNNAQITVRLIHVPTGKPVTNAVIFQTRLDMSPMGMKDMTAKAIPVKVEEPGLYKFQVPLDMAGDWALQLAAKVPGENDTIQGSVKITAIK